MVRNAGVHAAGVVISPRPLTELVPLHKTKNDEIVTAFDMVAIEKMGLLKMDFLGPDHADHSRRRAEVDRADTRRTASRSTSIPLDDQETYEKVFHKGLTSGVFQFESHGMRDVLRRYQPNSIEDLTALNALYRPGPIQGGMIDDFIDRKHGRKKIEYELPELQEILQETLGVIVYQEQVMQIANRLAGYSLGEADLLRRAMGKKEAEEMAAAARALCGRRGAARLPAEEDRKDFRSDGAVRRIRIQQIALGGLCAARLSHGLSEDALSGRVHGGAADLGHRQHRRRGEVHQRMPRDGHCRRAAGHQRQRRQLHAAWQCHPLRPGGGEECRPQRDRIDRGRAQEARPLQLDLRILRKSRPAAAQQARAGVADQERRHGLPRPPRPVDGRARQGHGAGAESAARRRIRPARPVRRVPAGRVRRQQPTTSCPTSPTGTNTPASPPKKKFSDSLSPGIRWKNIKRQAGRPARAQHRRNRRA